MTERARSNRPRLARAVVVALLVVGLCGASAAHAQTNVPRAADASAWTSLTPAQQSALQPLKRDWADIDAPRKQKWLEIAARMPSMSAEDRQRVQQRMAEWARLSPEERGRARLQFQEARQLSPQQRQSRWDAYMALPAEERRALAEAARTVPQSNKSGTRMAVGATPPAQKSGTGGKPAAPAPKAVAPTLVQAKPGASTTLISNSATPPAHAQAGQPKIAASKDVVNRRTLLPQAGPQAAAPAPAASSSR